MPETGHNTSSFLNLLLSPLSPYSTRVLAAEQAASVAVSAPQLHLSGGGVPTEVTPVAFPGSYAQTHSATRGSSSLHNHHVPRDHPRHPPLPALPSMDAKHPHQQA